MAVSIEPTVQSQFSDGFPGQILVTMEKQYELDNSAVEPTNPGPFRLAVLCDVSIETVSVFWEQQRVGYAVETQVTAWMAPLGAGEDCAESEQIQFNHPPTTEGVSPMEGEPLAFAIAFEGQMEVAGLDGSETVGLQLEMP